LCRRQKNFKSRFTWISSRKGKGGVRTQALLFWTGKGGWKTESGCTSNEFDIEKDTLQGNPKSKTVISKRRSRGGVNAIQEEASGMVKGLSPRKHEGETKLFPVHNWGKKSPSFSVPLKNQTCTGQRYRDPEGSHHERSKRRGEALSTTTDCEDARDSLSSNNEEERTQITYKDSGGRPKEEKDVPSRAEKL